jgi:small-conductance mechanosensitive channel
MMNDNAVASPSSASADFARFEGLWSDSARWIASNAVEILIAAAFAAAIVVVLMAIRSVGIRACRNDRLGTGWPGIFGRVIARTRIWFMVLLAAELVAGYTAPPPALGHTIQTLFTIAAALQGALWARELILGVIDHRAGIDPDHQTLGSAMGLIRVLVSVALFAIALVLILDNLGVNVTGLVAGLGIGGIAIGLAAQGIFSDLFAALAIIFDKPFRIGDTVRWDQTIGVVEQIGLKTTRVRSNNGEQVIVANSKLLEKELHNETHFEHRRFTSTLSVIYQTPPEVMERIPGIVREIVTSHRECTLIRCAFAGFGASSLDFELLFDIRAEPPADPFQIRSAIYLEILKRFSAEKIEFAYPTQTTFTAAPDGTMIMPYPPGK